MDREGSENMRRICHAKHVNKWVLERRKACSAYIGRINDERIAIIARNNSLLTSETMEGRPEHIKAGRRRINRSLPSNIKWEEEES